MCNFPAAAAATAGEGESVLVTVRDDDAGSPFDTVVKNIAHETKLKRWKHLSAEEKAADKLADVLEQVMIVCLLWLTRHLGSLVPMHQHPTTASC